ncbi:Ubiquitin carboxyl-terminal hydrolase [Actinidia chinensis var. chinensis]|uniref:Ubiquitin carboxyl-terminal hydrolase n=1 Tax=Actinidia chinensis var. chinensis TaxID=1590841 RepID=A0A2R6P614_ACTCC|nr:Ubiquitin carboxyl-terminal hydrolase [Actinidia chinensis var. chinensis]
MNLRHETFPYNDDFEERDAPPTHYSLKIQSFSLLSKASIEKYSSDMFEETDYKWKLSVYPTGNKERGGQGHISMSLTLVDTSSLPAGWEVKTIFNLLVFDQVQKKYFTPSDGKVMRFHAMKTEWDIPKFMDLKVFNDSSNGYLINDACVFGVDIFVLKQTRKGECLSMMEDAVTTNYTWKIKSFSTYTRDFYPSEAFTVGDHKWRIIIFPRGYGGGKGNSISMYLWLDKSTLPPDTRVFVKFILRVIDQNHTKAEPFEFKADYHFGPTCLAWGTEKFMSLATLNDPRKGFLVDDTCIIEASVTSPGTVTTS